MLIWMCALHCEAKPVIDYYRLKKNGECHVFDLYQGDGITCIVSGMGELNMAEACAWAAGHFAQHNLCWINLGIAGHASFPVGSLLLATQVLQHDNGQAIYPIPLIKHQMQTATLISQSSERLDYHATAAYDMEAYAFLHSCSRFTPLELCSCIKVISDNADTAPVRDKAQISQLIARHMQHIADYAASLQQIAADYEQQMLAPTQLHRFTQLAHFTRSQQLQLGKILLGLRAFDPELDATFQQVQQQPNSKSILQDLQRRLNRHSENLS